MPDVGVLSLQIEENSQRAYDGLDNLVDVLTRVKNAVAGGLKLTSVANGLGKLGNVVNEHISGSTIVKIGQLADELSKLKGLENVNIRINTGTSVESIRDAVQETRETLGNIDSGFEEVGTRVVETTTAVTGFKEEMQQFDPSKLPLSSLGKTLDEAAVGVKGDIDMVRKSFETLGYMGVFDRMSESVQEAGESVTAIIPYHENLENTWERITERMNEAKLEAAQAVETKPVNGIAMYNTIEEAAQALGITIDEANAKLRESHELVYGVPYPQITAFNTIEEAAQHLGITADEARQKVHMVVEEATSHVQDAAFESVGEGASRAERMVELLREKIAVLREEVENGTTATGNILSDKTIISNRIQIEKLTEQVEKLQERIRAGRDINGSAVVDALGDSTKIDLMIMKYDAMRDALSRDIDANRLDSQQIASRMLQINNLKDQIDSLRQKQEETTNTTHSLRDSFEELKDRISGLGISHLIKQFTRLARMRAMRAMIRQIAAGFREGVENVYNYSKAIGSDFSTNMDSAVSSLLQMKNAIGAAAAPLLQSLIPLMQTLVGWFIEGVNWLNQFVALLRGQSTWTRALPATASAFDKQTKAAKKAGNAIKDLLADWDELNIIQSETSGAGTDAASPAEDYLRMFEEVGHFDNTVKNIVDGLDRQFGGILNLVKKIGAVILAWKVSTLVTGIFGTLAGLLATAGIIDLVFNITTMLDNQYFKTGDIGWLIGDVLQTALGAFLANKVVSKVISAGAGKVAAGVTLAVSAVADVIALIGSADVTALSTEGILTAVKSGLKLGSGFMLFSLAAGVPAAEAIVAAGGVASIGIGAAIAIKAVAEAAQTGEITFETVKAGVAGAVAAGLGVTVFELIGGTALGTALVAGGAAALVIGAGFAAALGVVAMINKEHVQWGDINLTDDEVQTFVNTKMFTVSVPIAVKIIGDNLTSVSVDKASIETEIEKAIGTFNVIRLGVAKDEDYTTLAKEILGNEMDGNGGVVGAVTKYIDDAKAMGKLTLQFTPSLVGADATDASTWFTSYTTGWEKVDEFVKQRGAEIGKLLTTEEGRQIIESTPEVLAALMQQVSDVTNAVTGAQISSEAFANLQVTLGNLDESSYDRVISAYTDYLEQLRNKEKELVIQQYTSQSELVAALIATGADPNTEPLKSAIAKYEYMGQHINDAIEEGVESYSRPGAIAVVEFMQEHYSKALSAFADDIGRGFIVESIKSGYYGLEDLNEAFTGFLGFKNNDLANTLRQTGIYAWNVMDDEVKSRIRSAMEDAFGVDATKELIQKWESQTKEQIDESIKNLNGGNTITPPTVQLADVNGPGVQYPGVTAPAGGNGGENAPTGTQVSADISNASNNVVRALGSFASDIIRELQNQARRPIQVGINPTSAFARGVNASIGLFNRVTGDVNP